MNEDITIDVGMDPSSYLAGAQQVQTASSSVATSFGEVTGTAGGLSKAMSLVTPGRAAIAAWGGLAVVAGKVDSALSPLKATSAITGVNVDKLSKSMSGLAKSMPISNAAAQQLVTQFTKMGVSSVGSEKQIAQLSAATTKFAGATGQDLTSAAQSMTDFSRATGNVALDVKPYVALSDSITTVSAKMGAGAESMQAFGKNIAPMANVAGIGAASIVGISGAFTQLGEDGLGAQTAVNKMLSDMSRSVRDGTPDLAIYSSAVGKTTKEFTELYKANPAEALTQVTEAISQSATGPRLLEQLGLDSVRTMKSLTALSASGGLRPAIQTSIAGYGSGASETASKEAFGGLNDQATILTSSMEQLGVAMGKPLLAPLTMLTKALTVPVKVLGGIADSKFAQTLASGTMIFAGALGTAALSLMGLVAITKGLPKLLSTYGMGRQAVTSIPVGASFAGLAAGRGDIVGATRASRLGGEARKLMAPEHITAQRPMGLLGTGAVGFLNTRAYKAAVQMGEQQRDVKTAGWMNQKDGKAYAASAAGQKVAVTAREAIYAPAKPAVAEVRDKDGNLLKEAKPAVPATVVQPAREQVLAKDHMPTASKHRLQRELGAHMAKDYANVNPLAPGMRGAYEPAPIPGLMTATKSGLPIFSKDAPAKPAYETAAGSPAIAPKETVAPPNRFQKFMAGARGWGTAGFSSYQRMEGAALTQSQTPASERPTLMMSTRQTEADRADAKRMGKPQPASEMVGLSKTAQGGIKAFGEAARNATTPMGKFMAGMSAMNQHMIKTNLRTRELGDGQQVVAKTSRNVNEALTSFGAKLRAQGAMIMTGARDAQNAVGMAGRIGKFGGGLMSQVGNPMMVAMGAMALGTKLISDKNKREETKREEKRAFDASDIYAISNAYKSSAGIATKQAVSQVAVAGGGPSAIKEKATVAGASGKVTSQEIAESSTGKPVHKYVKGTNQGYVSQILAGAPGGLSPSEMMVRRADLLRQGVKPADVEAISTSVSKAGQIIAPDSNVDSIATKQGDSLRPKGTGTDLAKLLPKEDKPKTTRSAGEAVHKASRPDMSKDQIAAITGVVSSIGQQKLAEQERAGPEAAAQASYRQATTTYGEMKKEGVDKPALDEFAKQMMTQLNPTGSHKPVTDDEFKKFNGNFAEIMRSRGGKFATDLKMYEEEGLSTSMEVDKEGRYTKGVTGDTLPGSFSKMLRSAGDDFGANLFDQSKVDLDPLAKAISETIKLPGHADIQQTLAREAIAFGDKGLTKTKTGATGQQVSDAGAENITKLSSKIADLSNSIANSPQGNDATNAMIKVRDSLLAQVGQQQISMGAGQQQVSSLQMSIDTASTPLSSSTNPEETERVEEALESAKAQMASIHQQLQQKLEAQRNYEIARGRTTEAANLAAKNAQDSFERSVVNTIYSYNLQKKRANDDYNLSVKNAGEDFNLARRNQLRDFNTTMARTEADYLKGRKRAIRDFNVGVKRMVEDAAVNLYDPYTRIQTKATWDVKNLMGNMRQQNEAMAKQKQQLNQLRKQGLSQQVIDQLKLGDVSNQQQVNQMVGDFKKSPNDIAAINKMGVTRAKVSGDLSTDASNTAFIRSKKDFDKQMKDQAADQKTQVRRASADLAKGLSDQLRAFNTQMTRTRASHKLSVSRAAADHKHGLGLMAKENRIARQLARDALGVTLRNMAQDIANTHKSINGKTGDLANALQQSLKGKSGAWKTFMTNDTQTLLTGLGKMMTAYEKILRGAQTARAALSEPLPRTGHNQQLGGGGGNRQGIASGGLVQGFSPHPKADNIDIRATAGEFMQPVASVQHYGSGAMEAVRTRKATISYAEGGMIGMEQGRNIKSSQCTYMTINNNQKINNDYRNDFGNANITVVSGNPDDMASKLSRKATAQRINQTRGVAWSR